MTFGLRGLYLSIYLKLSKLLKGISGHFISYVTSCFLVQLERLGIF